MYCNIWLASYLFPKDFAIIAIPFAFFAVIEILIDGGNSTAIINKNITSSNLKELIRKRAKYMLTIAFLGFVSLHLFNYYPLENKVPFWAINFIFVSSVARYLTIFFEARLIANKKYLTCETYSFLSTIIALITTIIVINNAQIPGYMYLIINLTLQQVLFTFLILTEEKNTPFNLKRDHEKNNTPYDVYAKDVMKGALVEQVKGRIDEVIIAIYLSISNIGIYYKIKELAITFSGFGSKAIGRPWLYVSSISPPKTILLYWLVLSVVFIVLLELFKEVFVYLINILIFDVLGENWIALKDHTILIYYLSFLYFFYTFNKSTALGIGFSKSAYYIEVINFFSRVLFYGAYLIFFRSDYPLSIETLLLIEIAFWIQMNMMQMLFLIFLFLKKNISN